MNILVKDKFINGLKDTTQKRFILERKRQEDPLDTLIDSALKFEAVNELIKPNNPTFGSNSGEANTINAINNFTRGPQFYPRPRFTRNFERFSPYPDRPSTRFNYRNNFNNQGNRFTRERNTSRNFNNNWQNNTSFQGRNFSSYRDNNYPQERNFNTSRNQTYRRPSYSQPETNRRNFTNDYRKVSFKTSQDQGNNNENQNRRANHFIKNIHEEDEDQIATQNQD